MFKGEGRDIQELSAKITSETQERRIELVWELASTSNR